MIQAAACIVGAKVQQVFGFTNVWMEKSNYILQVRSGEGVDHKS